MCHDPQWELGGHPGEARAGPGLGVAPRSRGKLSSLRDVGHRDDRCVLARASAPGAAACLWSVGPSQAAPGQGASLSSEALRGHRTGKGGAGTGQCLLRVSPQTSLGVVSSKVPASDSQPSARHLLLGPSRGPLPTPPPVCSQASLIQVLPPPTEKVKDRGSNTIGARLNRVEDKVGPQARSWRAASSQRPQAGQRRLRGTSPLSSVPCPGAQMVPSVSGSPPRLFPPCSAWPP